MQNQSNSLITFDTQLKTALNEAILWAAVEAINIQEFEIVQPKQSEQQALPLTARNF